MAETCDKRKCIYSYTNGYNWKYKFETKIGFNDIMENIETNNDNLLLKLKPNN